MKLDISAMIRHQLQESVPFVRHVGISVDEVTAGTSTASLDDAPERRNHVGSHHAGALFTLGETASGAAMAGALGAQLAVAIPVASDANITYLRLAKGKVEAHAKVPEPPEALLERLAADGKVQFPVTVSLTDSEGHEVASMTVQWHVRKRHRD